MNQTDLAQKLGVTNSYISQLERGRRIVQIDRLEDICRALNCTPNDLLLSAESSVAPDQQAHESSPKPQDI